MKPPEKDLPFELVMLTRTAVVWFAIGALAEFGRTLLQSRGYVYLNFYRIHRFGEQASMKKSFWIRLPCLIEFS